jgi:hypothetical protein
MFQVRTAGAVNFLRGKIPGAVQGDQRGVLHAAIAVQNPVRAQRGVNAVLHRIGRFGRDRVEHLADLIVARNSFDLEKLCALLCPRAVSIAH